MTALHPLRLTRDALALAAQDPEAYALGYPARLAIADLIAWSPRAANRLWTRLGIADILGTPSSDGPTPLFSNPTTWLQHERLGICPATSDPRALRSALLGVPHLVARDIEHGRAVRAFLADPAPGLPVISVPTPLRP